LTACASAPPQTQTLPEVKTILVYPVLPSTKCARKPALVALPADDKAAAIFLRGALDAGDDCRDKLDAVDRVRESWPNRGER
jgi:hypothetical protein